MSEKSFKVGRHPTCALVLGDSTVSGRHAELTLTADGRLFVVDCGSKNGTFVISGGKKKQIRQAIVDLGAMVSFGDCEMKADLLAGLVRDVAARQKPAGRWVRCSCGAVKREGAPCGTCGAETRGPG